MVEVREVDTARAMLRQTAVFATLRQEQPDRFLRLEQLCGRTYFDIRSVPTLMIVCILSHRYRW